MINQNDPIVKQCPKCNRKYSSDVFFCVSCGTKLASIISNTNSNENKTIGDGVVIKALQEKKIAEECYTDSNIKADNSVEDIKQQITDSQRYFDTDYGYSRDNPVVVSSVAMMGYILMAFRTEHGDALTWRHEPYGDDKNIEEYSTFVNGKTFKSIYFNPHGYDTKFLPQGLSIDAGAFDAAKRGLTPVQYEKEIEDKARLEEEQRLENERQKKIAEENARIEAEKAAKQKEEQARIEAEEMARIIAEQKIADERAAKEKEDRKKREEEERKNKELMEAERKARNKKLYKKIAIIFAALCVIGIGSFLGYKEIKYSDAKKAYDAKNYEIAITEFDALNGYKDSEKMLNDAKYQYGILLFRDALYDEAKSYFSELSELHFEDSSEYVMRCDFEKAINLLEQEKYEASYDLLRDLDYSNSEQYKIDCLYHMALEAYGKQLYEDAYDYAQEYEAIATKSEVDASQYDIAFINDLKVLYAKSLIENHSTEDVNKAIAILESLTQTKETKGLITDAKKKLKQIQQDECTHTYTSVITKNVTCTADGEKKYTCSKCDYSYTEVIKATGHNYVNDKCSKCGAKLARSWKVTILAVNSSKNDETTNYTSISKYSSVYFHFKLTSPQSGGTCKWHIKMTFPDSHIEYGEANYAWYNGDTGWWAWEDGIWLNPAVGATGILKVDFYDEDWNWIGQGSVNIT